MINQAQIDESNELSRHINQCQNLTLWDYWWNKQDYIDKMRSLQSKYRDVSPILEHCKVEENLARKMNDDLNHAAYILQMAYGRKEILK